jgi:hypothetical protein
MNIDIIGDIPILFLILSALLSIVCTRLYFRSKLKSSFFMCISGWIITIILLLILLIPAVYYFKIWLMILCVSVIPADFAIALLYTKESGALKELKGKTLKMQWYLGSIEKNELSGLSPTTTKRQGLIWGIITLGVSILLIYLCYFFYIDIVGRNHGMFPLVILMVYLSNGALIGLLMIIFSFRYLKSQIVDSALLNHNPK